MMSMSFSMSSLHSFGSSKSLASFVDELSAATRLAEVASTGAAARSSRRCARPDSSVLPNTFFTEASGPFVVAPVNEDEAASNAIHRRRVRPESVLPGLLFAKPARLVEYDHEDDESESIQVATVGVRRGVRPESILPVLLFARPARVVEQQREDEDNDIDSTVAQVSTVGVRRRVRPESILPGLLFAKPLQSVAHEVEDEEPEPVVSEAASSSSIASMSSSKSLTSFKKDLFATGRLADLNTLGFEARAYRRRVRAVSAEQTTATLAPSPKDNFAANAAPKSSTMSLASRPLVERSPFTKYTPSGMLNLSSVRDRSGKSFGASPSFFADLEPEQEFRLRGALLLPGMQFTSSTVGAEKSDVLRSLTGELPAEKTSNLDKLVQVFKRI